MRAADHLIDIGPARRPRAADASSPKARRPKSSPHPHSITGEYLAGPTGGSSPRRPSGGRSIRSRSITLEGATTNNLKDVDVAFPLVGLRVRDRRQRLGQKLAGQRNAVPGARPAAWSGCGPKPGPHRSLRGASQSTSSSRSINRRSAARRGAIRPRTPACSTRSAKCLPDARSPACAAIEPAASASTSKGAAAKNAKGRGCKRSR